MNCIALSNWAGAWLGGESVPAGLVLLSLVATFGLALGAIRVRGIRLGISGVLFSGLLFGQIGLAIDPHVLQFLRDFSLVIFMYAIGLEIGPAFLSTLRTDGLRLNMLAVIVILLGAAMAVLISRLLRSDAPTGVFVGAFTTTAGLAAAQETLRASSAIGAGAPGAAEAALAYSITYPFGIVGPMLAIQMLQVIFRISIQQERDTLARIMRQGRALNETIDVEITASAYVGLKLRDAPRLRDHTILLSRLLRNNVVSVPTGDTELRAGDIYRAVGPCAHLERFIEAVGQRSAVNLSHTVSDIDRADLVVTRTHVLHRPLRDLNLVHRTGYTIASVNRAGVDLVPNGALRLIFADRVTVVGPRVALKLITTELGNSPEMLDQPRLIPIFLGIVLGVLLGSCPLILPGLHARVRLGLAGGPLIIAIVLAQLGNVGSIIWYIPPAASRLFRDFGLAIFLACVGLGAGSGFVQRAATGSGATMLLCGAVVTILPVFLIGCFARLVLKMNFITLSGWIAGTMSSSTTLLFAGEQTHSDVPALAYAAVTPLATLLPILLAQILAVLSTMP